MLGTMSACQTPLVFSESSCLFSLILNINSIFLVNSFHAKIILILLPWHFEITVHDMTHFLLFDSKLTFNSDVPLNIFDCTLQGSLLILALLLRGSSLIEFILAMRL